MMKQSIYLWKKNHLKFTITSFLINCRKLRDQRRRSKGVFQINQEAAADLLMYGLETVLPLDAVTSYPDPYESEQLEMEFMHLMAIFTMGPDQTLKYHKQMIKQYGDHGDTGIVIAFLQTSKYYFLDRAMHPIRVPKGFKSDHLGQERVHVQCTICREIY